MMKEVFETIDEMNLTATYWIGGALLIYFFPTIRAVWNKKRTSSTIFVVNFFFGWNPVIWFLLLFHSAHDFE